MAEPMDAAADAPLIAALVDRGCDLTKARQVGVHFDAESQQTAEAVAGDLRAGGWEPKIFDLRDERRVAADGKWMVVSEESIAELRRSAEDLATRHGATFTVGRHRSIPA